jgi:DNA-directed RNA polymerase specialized sigma24 family protein
MSAPGSVTVWIERLKAGDRDAAQEIWESYFRRLVGLARRKLQRIARAAADEEDVAISAFGSFFRAVEGGRFPRLDDREDLWQLLVLLTARKAYRLLQHERRQKRGGGAVRHLSALDDASGAAEVIGREPTPEFAAQVADECRQRLESLGDADLRAMALAKMEGYSTAEIAVRLGVTERTAQRHLRLIRRLWSEPGGEV